MFRVVLNLRVRIERFHYKEVPSFQGAGINEFHHFRRLA